MLRSLTATTLVLAFSTLALPQADPAILAKITGEGKNRSQVMKHLNHLSKKIGPRLSTSENLDRAYEWTQKKFKEFGCKNVHLEEWDEWPVGFQRGKCSGRMISPEARTFEFTTPSWTEGTHGRKKGFAILAPATMEEFISKKDDLKDAWIVYRTAPPRSPRVRQGETSTALTTEQQAAQDLKQAITRAGILGVVVPARGETGKPTDQGELVLTSGNFRDKSFESHAMDVSITIRRSDMDTILKNVDAGKKVELEFDINQKFIKGPRKLYNVVAEIPGTEKPDEVIIVGGHLDSWDGPGAEGAADDGTGVSCALEAARILNKVGARPKRTIRFVLFTAEEQGLFGSTAYVDSHKGELSKISAVFIEDGGANWESGTYALATQVPILQQIIDVNNATLADMQMSLRIVERMPTGGGSDHIPFNAAGVPAFFWDKKGDANYAFIHHTQHDKYELVPVPYTVQSATNEAVAVYIVACAPEMMPRQPAASSGGGEGSGK
jgi:carboxypeptidase Q